MDLLDDLIDQEGDDARSRIRQLVAGDGPALRTANWNCFDLEADVESGQATVWDVLDGKREPARFTIDELFARLS